MKHSTTTVVPNGNEVLIDTTTLNPGVRGFFQIIGQPVVSNSAWVALPATQAAQYGLTVPTFTGSKVA